MVALANPLICILRVQRREQAFNASWNTAVCRRIGYPHRLTGIRHQPGWQLIAGVRPLSVLGAEITYLNFGTPNNNAGAFYDVGHDIKAPALFAVAYLPVPLPPMDVFAKIGAARLQRDDDIETLSS